MIRRRGLILVAIVAAVLAPPAAVQAAFAGRPSAALPVPAVATTFLRDAAGKSVGWASFTEAGSGGVHLVVVSLGMSPGLHGFHIHTTGSCVGPDFASAGGHFNPLGKLHGAHAGDLPNLLVIPSGIGVQMTTTTSFSLRPGPVSIFDADGAALVIHANPDDYVTNPSGNSGPRIACGVITPFGQAMSIR